MLCMCFSAGAVDDHMEDALHNAMGQWHKFTANVSDLDLLRWVACTMHHATRVTDR